MKIVINIEPDDLTISAYIDGVEKPTNDQAVALMALAQLAGGCRTNLFGEEPR